jgi:hypothetical protein
MTVNFPMLKLLGKDKPDLRKKQGEEAVLRSRVICVNIRVPEICTNVLHQEILHQNGQ